MKSFTNTKNVKLMVAVPSGDEWSAAFGVSLAGAIFKYATYKVHPDVQEQALEVYNIRSSMLCQSRELIIREGFKRKATHILWLDSDMQFPNNTIHMLFSHNKAFVGTNCVRKSFPTRPTSVGLDEQELYSDSHLNGLQEVLHTGLAVALLRLEDIKDIPQPFFTMNWNEELKCYNGEDVTFCRKLRENGIPLYIDHTLSRSIGHYGAFRYDHTLVGETLTEEDYAKVQPA